MSPERKGVMIMALVLVAIFFLVSPVTAAGFGIKPTSLSSYKYSLGSGSINYATGSSPSFYSFTPVDVSGIYKYSGSNSFLSPAPSTGAISTFNIPTYTSPSSWDDLFTPPDFLVPCGCG